MNLWFNDECDVSCNTSECAYDFGECIFVETTITANTTCYSPSDPVNNWNDSYSMNSSMFDQECYVYWIGDSLCDTACLLHEKCEFDGMDCQECTPVCETLYTSMVAFLAGQKEPIELVTIDELCDQFSIVQYLGFGMEFSNCTSAFDALDLNNNSYLGMYEILSAGPPEGWGLDIYPHYEEKIQQINCSHCLANKSLYYW